MAPDRVAAFPYQPTHSLAALQTSLGNASQVVTQPSAPPGLVSAGLDVAHNGMRLGTTEVAATEAFAAGAFGDGTGISVVPEVPSREYAGRYKGGVPFLAGTMLRNTETSCEAGFGAWSRVGTKRNGDPIR
jgi:hypothetical protein